MRGFLLEDGLASFPDHAHEVYSMWIGNETGLILRPSGFDHLQCLVFCKPLLPGVAMAWGRG